MNEETKHIETTSAIVQPVVYGRFRRNLRRTVLALLIFMTSCSGGLFLLTQTDSFRHWLGEQILTLANDNLQAKVEFSDIGGNILTGLTFDNIRLISNGDTLLFAKKLTLRYDLEPLFSKTIVANELVFDSPVIKLLRSKDSVWNIDRIAKPPTDTSKGKPFDWTISARDVRFENGVFILCDSTVPTSKYPAKGRVNFSNLRLDDFNLSLDAALRFGDKKFASEIRRISFRDQASGFLLHELSLHAVLDTAHAEISDFTLHTAETYLKLDAQLEKVNILSALAPEEWESTPMQLALSADSVSTKDLQRFLPELDFLRGSPSLKLEAKGTYGDISIKKLRLGLDNSVISIAGKLRNLNSPEALLIDAKIDQTHISYRDVLAHVPGLHIPDLAYLGMVSIENAEFKGAPQDFRATLKASSEIGKVEGVCDMDTRGKLLQYGAELRTENLNLAPIFRDSSLSSSLSTQIQLSGEGTALRELTTHLHLTSQHSSIAGRSFSDLLISADAKNGGFITIDTLSLRWDNSFESGLTTAESSFLDVNGWINFQNPDIPTYRLSANARDVDLDKIIPKSNLTSNLTSTFQISGAGFHPDSIQGTLRMSLRRFAIPGRSFPTRDINIAISRDGTAQRELFLTSGIADVTMRGEFRFSTLLGVLEKHAGRISDLAENSVNRLREKAEIPADIADTTIPDEPLNLRFYVKLRDLAPLAIVSKNATLLSDAQLQGEIHGRTHDFSLSLDSSRIQSLYYRTKTAELNIPPTTISAECTNLRLDDTTRSALKLHLFVASDSTVTYNNLALAKPLVELHYGAKKIGIKARSRINDDISVFARAEMDIAGREYPLRFDSLYAGYHSEFEWSNSAPIFGVLRSDGLLLSQFLMKRAKEESVSLTGLLRTDYFSDVKISVKNFALEKIKSLLPNGKEIAPIQTLGGALRSLDISLNGTPHKPEISAVMTADSLFYNGVYVGSQQVQLRHSDGVVSGRTFLYNPTLKTTTNTLTIDVKSLPFNLAFEKVKERLTPHQPIDILFKAEQLPLEITQPFLSPVDQLHGFANAEFTIKGTAPDNVNYLGSAKFFKTSFWLKSTNIKYFAEGGAQLNNTVVTLENVKLYNDPLDFRGGVADVSGNLFLRGFDIERFDMYVRSREFLVMSNASKVTNPTLYGDMVIANGKDPIHFFGSFTDPFLRGDLDVKRAHIYFPEDKSMKRSLRDFCYEMVNKNGVKTIIAGNCTPTDTLKKSPITSATVETKESPTQTKTQLLTSRQSLMDIIDMDINVRILGRFFTTMQFGQFEQLVAEVAQPSLENPLHLLQSRTVPRQLFGDLDVKENSTYNFYRKFNAKGTMNFETGSIDNPKLNLTAVLSGQRTINDKSQRYSVTLDISGTKKLPKVKMSYSVDNVEGTGDSTKITTDAILLIALGKTQDELASEGKNKLNAGAITTQGISSGASQLLTDILQGTGIIRTVDINFPSNESGKLIDLDPSKLRLQFTGEISNVVFQIGNDMGLGTSEFRVDVPLSILFDQDALRNLVLQVRRSVSNGSNVTRQQKEWEAKLGYRITW